MKKLIFAMALTLGVMFAGVTTGHAQNLPLSCQGPPAIDPIKVNPPSWTGGLPGVGTNGKAVDPVKKAPPSWTGGLPGIGEGGQAICIEPTMVVASFSPAVPVAGKSVMVTFTVVSAPAGATVTYEHVGSDGYKANGTLPVGADGKARLTIPGGNTGVVDTITVRITGTAVSDQITFKFSTDLPPAGAEKSAINVPGLEE